MKPHDSREKLEEENNFYSALKLEKYGGGLKLKISDFVSFLAWTGTMVGVLGILASLELFILPTDSFSNYLSGHQPPVVFYVLGVVALFTSTVWLALHLTLRKRNVNNDFEGIKKILKIKCYITGTFEIVSSIMGLMASILVAMTISDYQMSLEYINIIEGVICFLYLVFASCKIHGVRKDNNRYINSYIIFKLINFVVFVALGISFLVALLPYIGLPGTACILFIFGLILFSFVVIYCMGAVVVLLNINLHVNSKTNYRNLAFTNQAFWDGNTKSQA